MRKYLIFLLCSFLYSQLEAQWFEGNLYLPDSFGGTYGTSEIIWNSTDDKIYLGGGNETFVAIECENDERVQPIRINADAQSQPRYFEWNGGNNHLYIMCKPHRAYYDSLFIVDCQTGQTVNIIPFARRSYTSARPAVMCANPISNKVYLVDKNVDSLIYVIDGNTHQIIKTIKYAAYINSETSYPSLKWNPINNCLYLTGYIPHSDTGLAVIDCTADSLIAFSRISGIESGLGCFVLDTILNKLYFPVEIIGPGHHYKICELDCATNNITREFSINCYEFALNPENRKIYYTNDYSIYIFDIDSGNIEDSILAFPTPYYTPFLTYYSPNQELYCFYGGGSGTIVVVDFTTDSVSYYSPPDAIGGVFRPFFHISREKLYLSLSLEGEAIAVFNCQTKTWEKVIYHGLKNVGDMVLNSSEQKIYFSSRGAPYCCIFDSENNRALHQVRVAPSGYQLYLMGFVAPHNKIYISYPGHIAVLDCRTDSVVKMIDGLASYYALAYNSILDKMYTLDLYDWGPRITYVIDCTNDSVIKELVTTRCGEIKFDSLTNKVYLSGFYDGTFIIDCSKDSILYYDTLLYGNILFRTQDDRRVYVNNAMFDRFTDSLLGYLPFTFDYSEYNSNNDILYLAEPDRNKINVVDCQNHTLIDSIINTVGFISGMYWNHLNNKLYFTPLDNNRWYEPVMVADCQTNEVIATFPQINRARLGFRNCLNTSNNRLYIASHLSSKVGMIRDNIYGIEEIEQKLGELKVYPTLGRRFNIESEKNIVVKIFSALGEKVNEFTIGREGKAIWDGRDSKDKKLSKGVYFISTYPKSSISEQSEDKKQVIKKVVLF